VAYSHQGQRAGRPHVAAWAETEIVLAADLGSGTDDPRATAPDLLRRALAALPERARAGGRVAARVDAGYFAGQVARAAHDEHIAVAIGAKRIAPLWRLLDGIGEVSAGPRSRRRRTLHPGQRALPIPELTQAGAIYGYSFILTNPGVSAPDKAAAAEHWYRHRTTVENIFCDSKHGAALRHLPSAIPRSVPPGCGARCWPPAWPPGCISSPLPPAARSSWTATASAAARP
jgi:hypothetical protein